jgi:hypothetical protein
MDGSTTVVVVIADHLMIGSIVVFIAHRHHIIQTDCSIYIGGSDTNDDYSYSLSPSILAFFPTPSSSASIPSLFTQKLRTRICRACSGLLYLVKEEDRGRLSHKQELH